MLDEYEKCLAGEIDLEATSLLESFRKNGIAESNPVVRRLDRIGLLARKLLGTEPVPPTN